MLPHFHAQCSWKSPFYKAHVQTAIYFRFYLYYAADIIPMRKRDDMYGKKKYVGAAA